MNKLRRKLIHNIIKTLREILDGNNVICVDLFEDILDKIVTILDEEETYFYNIPENLQSGFRYNESENAIDKLEDAISELEDIDEESTQDEIKDCIMNAIKNLSDCV